MKKFINRPENVVDEELDGIVLLGTHVARLPGHKVIVSEDPRQLGKQVAVISGGGSGHEPAHAGYVGAGMLSAAVAGEIFTSPSTDAVLAAIRAVAGKPGALLVVKNYTGDRLNFGLAAEMARAEGIPVETVLVTDDVALRSRSAVSHARGLAGTVFVHKLLGAAAAEGRSLAALAQTGRDAVDRLVTMGVSFSAGTSPLLGKPSFLLGDQEIELGLGIHGEPGVRRATWQPADELTNILLNEMLLHGNFGAERRVAVMVNNLGATTPMELSIIAGHVVRTLRRDGYVVERVYAGTFLSSLDMAGVSISLLGVDDEYLRWLDAPTAAPAWPNAPKQQPPNHSERRIVEPCANLHQPRAAVARTAAENTLQLAIEVACRALVAAEPELTELDRITGDGDLGISMARAAMAVEREVPTYPLHDLPGSLQALAHTLARELGGSSGPLYGVFFLRCARALKSESKTAWSPWAHALEEGCTAISELGGAVAGDRTMLDALIPFTAALKHPAATPGSAGALTAAVRAAEEGADATAHMSPKAGRSSYLGDRVLGHPDPGAKAVVVWLRAVAEVLLRNPVASSPR